MVALGSIYANQANKNKTTAKDIKQLLDYFYTHPDATL